MGEDSKIDGLAKSLVDRHPGEPRISPGAGSGVQIEAFKRKAPPTDDV
jgi:hypothetical protein